jgi:hypothetical protein
MAYLTPTTWRKSTFSTGNQNCVELATAGNDALLRDSKHPDAGHLTFTRTELAALVAAASAGELDELAEA